MMGEEKMNYIEPDITVTPVTDTLTVDEQRLIIEYNNGWAAGIKTMAEADTQRNLRDEFAGAALSGAIANHGIGIDKLHAARFSYLIADVMLAARGKNE